MALPNKKLTQNLGARDMSRILNLYEAVKAVPAAQRDAELERLAGGDARIMTRVRSFLGSQMVVDRFLEDPLFKPQLAPVPAAQDPQLELGEQIGDFIVMNEIGRGAFARVYLAKQLSLERIVALKVCAAKLSNEGRTLAQLDHDNIVRVYSESVLPERNLRIICMQFIPGITLEDVIEEFRKVPRENRNGISLLKILRQRSGTLDGVEEGFKRDTPEPIAGLTFEELGLWLMAHVARALEYAHSHGVLHLDIKPSNILLQTTGKPFLGDFNVSASDRDSTDGAPVILGGTLDYMSPEQYSVFESPRDRALSAKVGPASDIFSLGVVLHEYLNLAANPEDSAKATDGESRAEEKSKVVGGKPCDDIAYFPLRAVVERCLNENPAARFSNAAAFAESLRTARETLVFPRQKKELRYAKVFNDALALLVSGYVNLIPGLAILAFTGFMAQAKFAFTEQLAVLGAFAAWNVALVAYWHKKTNVVREALKGRRHSSLAKIHQARHSLLILCLNCWQVTTLGWLLPLSVTLILAKQLGQISEAHMASALVLGGTLLFAVAASWSASLPRRFLFSVYLSLFLGSNQLKARVRAETKSLGFLIFIQALGTVGMGALIFAEVKAPGLFLTQQRMAGLGVLAFFATLSLLGTLRNLIFRRGFLARLDQ